MDGVGVLVKAASLADKSTKDHDAGDEAGQKKGQENIHHLNNEKQRKTVSTDRSRPQAKLKIINALGNEDFQSHKHAFLCLDWN